MYLGIFEFLVFVVIAIIAIVVIALIQKWYNDTHFKLRDGDLDKDEKSPMFDFFMKNKEK